MMKKNISKRMKLQMKYQKLILGTMKVDTPNLTMYNCRMSCIILSFEGVTFAADVPAPEGHIYIQDFANVLSADQKEELTQYGIQLEDGTSAQLGVLLLPSIGDEAVDSFAVKALREYGLGTKEKDNGALLVVTTETNSSGNRHFFLTTGYGLEGALPDGKVGRIIDEVAMPYLQQGQADLAVVEIYKIFYNEIAAEYGWDGNIESASSFSDEANSKRNWCPFSTHTFYRDLYTLPRHEKSWRSWWRKRRNG